jgi:hypothetical protein
MKAQVYVNRHIVAANKKATRETGVEVDNPALSISTYRGTLYAKQIEFTAGCKLIQDAANARCSGATIWLECDNFESLIIDGCQADRSMFAPHKDLDLEEYFWQFVSDAGWDKNKDYEAIARRLSSKYGLDKRALQVMFSELQKKLMEELERSGVELGVSDDSFDDLTAHIIGMGRDEYYRVLNEPQNAIAHKKSYVESFAYVFLTLEA